MTRVGSRLAAAANRPDYHWEFVVLENDQETHAFCFPGGKAGIFTGTLKYTRDEAGLATVLAHEMGHALARHTARAPEPGHAGPRWGAWGSAWGWAGSEPLAGQAIGRATAWGSSMGILPIYSRDPGAGGRQDRAHPHGQGGL